MRVSLAMAVDALPRPRTRTYVRYEGPEAPCDVCWRTGSRKRALFFDRKRKRKLCAKCMVRLMDMREAEP